MDSRELLAAVRAAQGIPSNYRLARVLGLPDTTLQRWNTGSNTPDDMTAARLAELAGLEPGAVVAAMHAQRAKAPEERALWQGIAAKLQRAAATVGAAVLALFITIGPDGGVSLGGEASAAPVNSAVPVLYIVRSSWRRLLRLVRRLSSPLGRIEPAAA